MSLRRATVSPWARDGLRVHDQRSAVEHIVRTFPGEGTYKLLARGPKGPYTAMVFAPDLCRADGPTPLVALERAVALSRERVELMTLLTGPAA